MHGRLVAIGVAVIGLATTVGAANASHDGPPTARNGAWIAYSTAPITGGLDGHGLHGSDVYVVREGHAPILVASRNDTGASRKSWHKCPAFSPDGTELAYGTRSQGRLSISIIPLTRIGATLARKITLKVEGSTRTPCPQWSPDGSRLANVNAREVIEYGLDGSHRRVGAGDPRIRTFQSRHSRFLVSPSGDLVARSGSSCGVVIERRARRTG
jgi:WD40-like Beta Propeller Repeat